MRNIRPEFAVHRLNEDGLDAAETLAIGFSDLLGLVESMVPPGRERAIVATKMQEACFYAKRGMAMNGAYQVQPADEPEEDGNG